MAYKYITNRTSPNRTVGRGGRKINAIVIHWWGDPNQKPSTAGVVNWLCNPAAQVSAHYVISGTNRQVYHLVNDKDTAWHAGNFTANQSTLGLELDPRCRDSDYDVAAEVIADLWKAYGKLPLKRHKDYISTACPGNYSISRLQKLAEAKLTPTKPPAKPTPTPPAATKLPKALEFTAKIDASVWNLNTYPNWKSVTTVKKGDKFTAYAQIKFNNSIYYVTKYSFDKGLKNGINQVDLVAVKPPAPKPAPTPDPTPELPVTEKPDYAEENNRLLNILVDLVKQILDKLTKVFK